MNSRRLSTRVAKMQDTHDSCRPSGSSCAASCDDAPRGQVSASWQRDRDGRRRSAGSPTAIRSPRN